MAKPWSEVAESAVYQALPSEQQDAARQQYFDQQVAPRVPEDQRSAAWEQFSADAGAGRRSLPSGVTASPEGAGRGGLNPDLAGAVPAATAGSVARDVASGALQIGPTAVKGLADLTRLATGDRVGKGVSDSMEEGMQAIRSSVGSERAAAQRAKFDRDMADPDVGVAQALLDNKGALADQVLPTLGSMILPVGVAGAAGKAATAGKAAQVARAIDEATVLARAEKARQAAAIGTTVAQNAADTYSTVRDAGGDQAHAYGAAAITAPITALAGKLTGGAAEAQAARMLSKQAVPAAAGHAALAIPKAMAKEGLQEAGEEAGQYLGESIGTDQPMDAGAAGKRLAVAGTLGAAMGGGVDVAAQTKERIARLRDGGDTAAADLLQQRFDQHQTAASVGKELEGMQAVAPELPFHGNPAFTNDYQALRMGGAKPAEAAARAGMTATVRLAAPQAGMSPKAADAILQAMADAPLDKVPAMVQRYVESLAKAGALPPGTPVAQVGRMLTGMRDAAMHAAVQSVYAAPPAAAAEQESPASTMDAIQALEQQQQPDVPGIGPDAPGEAESGTENVPPVPGNVPVVPPADDPVHAAATSPHNDLPEPTRAQKDAGNYKVGRMRIAGMDLSIENPQGSVRRGVDPDGKPWETPMQHHYGYIRGTTATDGDKLDVFVVPGTPSDYKGPVFVVDQVDPATGKLDEHKVVLGAKDEADAEQIYRSNYTSDWQGLGAMTRLPMPAFKAWAASGSKKEPLGELPAPPAAQPQPDLSGAHPADLLSAAQNPTHPLTDAAAAELRRRETEHAYRQREAQVVQERGLIVDEARDQQADQAAATGRAQELEAPTAMAEALARAKPLKSKKAPAPSVTAAPVVPAAPVPLTAAERREQARTERVAAENPMRSFLGRHGIALTMRRDFAPGRTEQRQAMVGRFGPIFRRSGLEVDQLAQRAVEEGFLLQPDVQQLESLIERALSGERVVPLYAPGAAEAEMESRIARQREIEEDAAAAALADLSNVELGALWEASNSNSSTEDMLRAFGASEEEIEHAIAEEARRGQQEAADRQGSGKAAAGSPAARAEGRDAAAGPSAARGRQAPLNSENPADAGFSDFGGDDFDPLFSRGEGSARRGGAADTAGKVHAAEEEVRKLTAGWKNGPQVTVVATPADLPVPAPADVKGLYLAGKAYIVASTQQPFMIARTLAHEVVAHYGLRAVLGQDGFKRLMSTMQMALASGNKPLREIRDDVRRLYVDEGGRFNLTPAQEADEIAALAVERAVDPKTGQFRTGMSWLKQTWARVADFLRQHGINVPFSVAELHGMLAASFENIRGGQRLQGADRMLVAASRGEADPAHLDGTEIAGELPSVELRKAVMSWAEEHLIGRSIINADTDASIAITRQGIKHGINGANEPELRLIAALPHLLRTAKLAEQVPDKLGRDHIKAVYRYVAHAVLRGEPMEVGIVVREGADGHRYYDHFILQKQTPAGQSVPRSPMEQPNAGVASPTGVPEAASGGQDSGTRKLGDQPASGDGRIVGTEKKSSNSPDTGSFSRGSDSQATWQPPEASRVDRVIYELQDGRVDLKRTQEAIAAAGRDIDERFDARLAETLYPGRVARRSEQFLDGEVKPLLEQMARDKVSMDELADYLHARGAPERNAQIAKVNPDMPDGGAGTNTQGVLMTDAAAATHLAGLAPMRRAVLAKLAEQVDAVTAGTRTLLVAEGLEKQETIDAWQAAYKHYVPMFRDEAQSGAPHPQGAGFSVRGSATKRATGSKKGVTNILAHVLMQREAAITRAEKNRVAVSLYGLALTNPNPDFWTTIRPGMQAEQIAQELDAMGIDKTVAEAGMRGVPTIRSVDPITDTVVDRPNPIYKSMPGALTLKVNGEDRVLLLNEKDERALRMAESMKNLDGLTRFDLAGSIVGKTTRWMAAVNTQYNPAFGLVNLVRDTLGGAINTGSTAIRGQTVRVLRDVPAAIAGIGLELAGRDGGKWGQLYREFQNAGGETGYREAFRDAGDRTKAIERELAAAEKAGKLTPGKVGHAILDLLEGFNSTLENAVRVAAFAAARDKGLSKPEAARLGRELTVDFNRKGRATRELGPLYAFFNASVQGSARTLQVLKGPTGAKIVAGGFALGVMQALMLAAAGYDDDEIPDFVKTRALIVPLPTSGAEKRYVAVPLPLGLHVIPNTGRVITELVLNGGKDIAQRTVDAVGEIAGAFNPLGGGNVFTADGAIRTVMPTFADPVVELGFNKNFAGRQIERETRGETDVRPGHERARESTLRSTTGQAYRGISKAINTLTGGTGYEAGLVSPTPERVQYIAQVAGGGLLREFEKMVNGASAATAGEKVPASRIPVAGRFYGEVDDDAVQRARYFEAGKKLDKVQVALKAAQKAGDIDAVSRMLADHSELAMARAQDRVQTAIAKLNRIAVTTVGDRETLQQVDQARLLQMRALNDAMRELENSTGKPTLAQRLRGTPAEVEVTTR